MRAGTVPDTTRPLKPSVAEYLPSERQKILGVVGAPTTPDGYSSSGFSSAMRMMFFAARWPLTSAVCPSFSSRLEWDIMSPTQNTFGSPSTCKWSLTWTAFLKPNDFASDDAASISVFGSTPTHLYTMSAETVWPPLRVTELSPIVSTCTPSIILAPRCLSHCVANSHALRSKPGRTAAAKSTNVTVISGRDSKISAASSTPTAPAPTMITDFASDSRDAACLHEALRSCSVGSATTGLIGSW
mmetsp:Transcript_1712/g.3584  ORF Transcript_1712/g.3584 Transcript_1712/m.3584 type:complete len:243 (-) Transcript_1712:484-1212(-)